MDKTCLKHAAHEGPFGFRLTPGRTVAIIRRSGVRKGGRERVKRLRVANCALLLSLLTGFLLGHSSFQLGDTLVQGRNGSLCFRLLAVLTDIKAPE